MKKRILALILACLMLFTLVACGGGDDSAKTDETAKTENKTEDKKEDKNEAPVDNTGKKTKVTAALSSNCPTLTPAYKINLYTHIIQSEIFEHLGQYDKVNSENFIGIMMKNWEKVDLQTYNIELYDYIVDSAGNPFKASDAEYAIMKSKDAGVASAQYVESVEVTDDYTFTMHLTQATLGLFEEVCQNLWMFTQAAMEASADEMATDPVGTGPYVVTDYVPGSHCEMEKRDDYWQKDDLRPTVSAANVDVIRTEFITEATQMAIAVETGAVQIGCWLKESIVPDLANVEGMVQESFQTINSRCTVFNCSEYSIFGGENGKLLRQAVCYGLDKDMLVTLALNDVGYKSVTWGNPGTIGYNKDWEDGYYAYDLEKAKELMAQAGYPDGFSCTFVGVEDNTSKSYMQAFQTLMAGIGIDVQLQFVTSAINTQTQNDLTAGWDMAIMSYSPGNNYQSSMFNSYTNNTLRGHGRAAFGVKDDHLQELTIAATAEDWTQADVDALHDYVVENAFLYKHYQQANTANHVPELEELYLNWRQDLQLGSCTYSADWPYFAE